MGKPGALPKPARAQVALLLAMMFALSQHDGAAAEIASDACTQLTAASASAECAAADASRWKQRLDAAYQGLTTSVEPSQSTLLVDAQRLWIRYRNTNCGFYAAASGSAGRVQAAECVRVMTRQRACELETARHPRTAAPAGCH